MRPLYLICKKKKNFRFFPLFFLEDCEVSPSLKLDCSGGGGLASAIGSHLVAIPPPPRSPLKSVVRAYLPNEQRTIVQVKPGQTVREALSKAMKLRKLDPSKCAVYRCSQPEVLPISVHQRDYI